MPRPSRSVLRALVPTTLAGALLLSGCAVTPPQLDPAALPEVDVCAAPGEASDAVQATGDLGSTPRVTASGPFFVDRVERSVLIEGSGRAADVGDLVAVTITMINATTGERAPATTPARVLLRDGAAQPGLIEAIRCSPLGSRIAAVVPSEQAFGSVGQPELAIGPGDDVVLVIDVLALVPQQAEGAAVDPPEGFPALGLEFDPDGRPRVSIPEGEPPTESVAAALVEGRGAVVGEGDEFLVHFHAVNWNTGEVFDESWGDAPRSLLSILPGVDSALIGRTVGSRVVVVVAPVDGFGAAGSPSSGVAATDTVVYVVDILATTPAPA